MEMLVADWFLANLDGWLNPEACLVGVIKVDLGLKGGKRIRSCSWKIGMDRGIVDCARGESLSSVY